MAVTNGVETELDDDLTLTVRRDEKVVKINLRELKALLDFIFRQETRRD